MVQYKKGTPEYEAWITTEVYKNLCVGRSERTRGKNNPCFGRTGEKHPMWKRRRLDISDRFSGEKNPNYGGILFTEETIVKQVESAVGGFWYGNVKYLTAKRYCNMWTRLRDSGRIGACWDFKSVLSGKTDDLVYHHVYYQEKACCHWDEDHQGYYALINIGTSRNQNWYKYYIPGDPNKFVPLTRSENSMVNGNRLKWIKIFEDIIDKNGGKCYLTKEEKVEYNHRQ